MIQFTVWNGANGEVTLEGFKDGVLHAVLITPEAREAPQAWKVAIDQLVKAFR